jgi:S1-C subfamily serine protease
MYKIGRALENDLILSDDTVSGSHAELNNRDGRTWITDLSSSNGTYVNRRRITEVALVVGDRVAFGSVEFVFDGSEFVRNNNDGLDDSIAVENFSEKIQIRSVYNGVQGWLIGLAIVVVFIAVLIWRPSQSMSTTEVARATLNIWMLDSNDDVCGGGSGALIENGKYLVSNAHVIDVAHDGDASLSDCTRIVVGLSDESGRNTSEYVDATLVSADHIRDLGIAKLDKQVTGDRKSFQIRDKSLQLEEKIRVFGFPVIGGDSLTVTSGIISGLDNSSTFPFFKSTADISPGNSGGPVVDSKGLLVGIATAVLRQAVDCSIGNNCYSGGNALGLIRPIEILGPLIEKIK